MEKIQNLLFIVYLLRQREHQLDVCYYGCREILIPDHKTPTHIRGIIEFDGTFVPVIDPGIFFERKATVVTNSACILVIEHIHESRTRRTGIIIEDIDEIMNLAAGSYGGGALVPSTVNMSFVTKMLDKAAANDLLSDTHFAFDLYAREKQAEADFALFQKIASLLINKPLSELAKT